MDEIDYLRPLSVIFWCLASTIAQFNAEKYVISWLHAGKHGALDKATGLPAKFVQAKTSSLPFV